MGDTFRTIAGILVGLLILVIILSFVILWYGLIVAGIIWIASKILCFFGANVWGICG